jgi:hypothetical protein
MVAWLVVSLTATQLLFVRHGLIKEIPLIHEDYFHGRLETADQELGQVTITIGIGSDDVSITRAVFRPQILKPHVKFRPYMERQRNLRNDTAG